MPIIQNWDFQPGKKTNTTKDERKRNYPKERKSREIPKPKQKNFSEQELLAIKESLKYFRKLLMDSGDKVAIQRIFKTDSNAFFVLSDSIFNKIYENLQIIRTEYVSENNLKDLMYSKADFWNEKPVTSKVIDETFSKLPNPSTRAIEEKTLIQKLKSMNKSQRLDYWRNNQK